MKFPLPPGFKSSKLPRSGIFLDILLIPRGRTLGTPPPPAFNSSNLVRSGIPLVILLIPRGRPP